ncbi:hypothetical protein LXA43DRAFT_979742 [Ganoderma leucocontextum]|nr:hypothetical protein LXA43DRAFT_979742 [Ganoderma leucocontextum]
MVYKIQTLTIAIRAMAHALKAWPLMSFRSQQIPTPPPHSVQRMEACLSQHAVSHPLTFEGSGAHRHQSGGRRCDTTGNAAVSGSIRSSSRLMPYVLVEYKPSILGYSRSSHTSASSFMTSANCIAAALKGVLNAELVLLSFCPVVYCCTVHFLVSRWTSKKTHQCQARGGRVAVPPSTITYVNEDSTWPAAVGCGNVESPAWNMQRLGLRSGRLSTPSTLCEEAAAFGLRMRCSTRMLGVALTTFHVIIHI